MSTVKAFFLKHPSSPVNNVTMSADGSVAFGGAVNGGGLDHVAAVNFSGASSVPVNNCFTSKYVNYRLLITHYNTTNTAGMTLALRTRAAGVDVTTGYLSSMDSFFTDSAAATMYHVNVTTYIVLSYAGGSAYAAVEVDVLQPLSSGTTQFTGSSISANPATMNAKTTLGGQAPTGAVDGFNIYPSLGVMDGTVRVYGYRNG